MDSIITSNCHGSIDRIYCLDWLYPNRWISNINPQYSIEYH